MECVRQYIMERIREEDRGFSSPCWIWQLSLSNGYGQGLAPGYQRVDQMHRVSYREFVGTIPAGHHIDHLCRITACCNPDHLEAVTPAENTRRQVPFMAHALSGAHCKNGHPISPENIKVEKNGRRCRVCLNEWRRRVENPRRAAATRKAGRGAASNDSGLVRTGMEDRTLHGEVGL